MGLMDVINRLLFGEEDKSKKLCAGDAAKNRLRVVLAHDRSGLDEQTMLKIRNEIREVIAKYVVIDEEGVNFDLHSDERLTMVTATFPLADNPVRAQPGTATAAGTAVAEDTAVAAGAAEDMAEAAGTTMATAATVDRS